MDFWYECVDWDMIKLFYALMMLFFTMVGVFTFIYLLYCFNFNEKMWYWYFPGKQIILMFFYFCRNRVLKLLTFNIQVSHLS